jgi:hypothetical protein
MTTLQMPYSPRRAWALAGVYLLLLLVLSGLAGTPARLLAQPLLTAAQLRDPFWWLLLLASVAVTSEVYGRYWRRHTLRFGRRLRPLPQAAFGLAWGFSLGLWMVSLLQLSQAWLPPLPPLPAALLGFSLISVWQAFSQSYFWGVYVTPEHDTPRSNRTKVGRCHVPHLAISVLFLTYGGNGALFIALQMLALTITSVAMRMPVWWEPTPQQPPTCRPGLLGLARTHGWVGPDPA